MFENNQSECFNSMLDFLVENEPPLDQCTKANISASLKGLCVTIRKYFPRMRSDNDSHHRC
jgi:hypothetical protein